MPGIEAVYAGGTGAGAATATATGETEETEGRMIKKSRTQSVGHVRTARIFQPFRALGYVTNDVPFSVHAQGQAFFVTTSVGTSFQVFDVARMQLIVVGPELDAPISAIVGIGERTLVGSGEAVVVCERGREVSRWESPSEVGVGALLQLLVIGPWVVALHAGNALRVWDAATGKLTTEVAFAQAFQATVFAHPATYINKVVVGGGDGRLQLWNVATGTLVHEQRPLRLASTAPITAIAQAPVLDVVAVGSLSGEIVLVNLRNDSRLMSFAQSSRVTCLSFRSDGPPILASSSPAGDVALWDLDARRLMHTMHSVHDSSVTAISFLNGQPLLLTAGPDNSLKQFVFDSPDGLPRLLKFRAGHSAAPTCIRYYGNDGSTILSASRDRSLRAFSVVRDSQSVELSQGSIDKRSKIIGKRPQDLKCLPIVHFAASEFKAKYFDNVVTAHSSPVAHTWSTKNKRIGSHELKSLDESHIKTVGMSHCGNFAILGCASGRIECYNIQSGIHRKTFCKDGHSKSVSSIIMDSCNRVLVSGSLDKTVKFWSFATASLLKTLQVSSAVSLMISHPSFSLFACALDDLSILVVDIETRKIVRDFVGHMNRITDMCFSPDGRWLLTASLDSTIRTWDLPSGVCIDIQRVEKIATSVAFSPTGDFLATSHVGEFGIFLWANKAQFETLNLKPVTDKEEFVSSMPRVGGLDYEVQKASDEGPVALSQDFFITPDQLAEQMITLSGGSRSKWSILLNIDTIKARNKPKEAPKKPEKAPFFLPTVAGLAPKFASMEKESQRSIGVFSDNRAVLGQLGMQSEFINELREGFEINDFSNFNRYINQLSPSSLAFHLSTLSPMDSFVDFRAFMTFITTNLSTRKDFDANEAYLNVFLKEHGEIIMGNWESLEAEFKKLTETHSKLWKALEERYRRARCGIDLVRGGRS